MNAAENEKIHAMHKRFGTCGVLKCDGCTHLLSYKFTNWRLTYPACGMRDIEQDMKNWTPVFKQLYPPKKVEQPINGQVRMEV